jgi:hypothetical protein
MVVMGPAIKKAKILLHPSQKQRDVIKKGARRAPLFPWAFPEERKPQLTPALDSVES